MSVRFVLINDGSTKSNFTEHTNLTNKLSCFDFVSYEENKGKGYALRYGMKSIVSDYILFTDIDFPYKLDSLLEILRVLSSKTADVVVGVRDQNYYQQIPFKRKLISKILRLFNRTILRLKVDDTQCGLKGFTQSVKPLFLETKIDRFLFDAEFIKLVSRRKDLTIVASDVILREGISLSSVGVSGLLRELKDYLRLVFR